MPRIRRGADLDRLEEAWGWLVASGMGFERDADEVRGDHAAANSRRDACLQHARECGRHADAVRRAIDLIESLSPT